MKPELDNYYDLISLLGKISSIVEEHYYEFDSVQLTKINMYYETILFHINTRSPRNTIFRELESFAKFINNKVNKKK
jgi:hypothetical protein